MVVRASGFFLALGATAALGPACGSRIERGHPPPSGWKTSSPGGGEAQAGDKQSEADTDGAGALPAAGQGGGETAASAGDGGHAEVSPGGEGGTASGQGGAVGEALAGGAGDSGDAGIAVLADANLVVHEWFGSVTFEVALLAPPTANVTIELVSSDSEHAEVEPAKLVFTPFTWRQTQTVTVQAVDDQVKDQHHFVTIDTAPAQSDDPRYDGIDAENVSVMVYDDTDPALIVQGNQGITTEAGGTATITIVLGSKPTASLLIPLSSSDPSEGKVQGSLVIEPGDWQKPHAVTVTGVDDLEVDGAQPYKVKVGPIETIDPSYAGMLTNVSLTNVDDDS